MLHKKAIAQSWRPCTSSKHKHARRQPLSVLIFKRSRSLIMRLTICWRSRWRVLLARHHCSGRHLSTLLPLVRILTASTYSFETAYTSLSPDLLSTLSFHSLTYCCLFGIFLCQGNPPSSFFSRHSATWRAGSNTMLCNTKIGLLHHANNVVGKSDILGTKQYQSTSVAGGPKPLPQ